MDQSLASMGNFAKPDEADRRTVGVSNGSARLLVTGATGELGQLVIADLLRTVPAENIVASVRSKDNPLVAALERQGVEVRVADYADAPSMMEALRDIDHLLLISSNAPEGRIIQHSNVIDAALSQNVKLLVYTSLLNASESTLGLAYDHDTTEKRIIASGIPYVILRNGWYTENYFDYIPTALEHGVILGSAQDGRFSTASRQDYAAAAALALTGIVASGSVLQLAGDDSFTLSELAATISDISGKLVTYQDLPKDDLVSVLSGYGLPRDVAELIADADVGASKGFLHEQGRQLSSLLGRPTIPYRDIFREKMAAERSAELWPH